MQTLSQSKIKKEKFSNNLQNSKNINFCDQLQKMKCDPDSEKWLCIECGFVGCSRNTSQQCSLVHYDSSKHRVMISLMSKSVWCYECDDDFDSMIEAYEEANDGLTEKVQKMKEFADMIKQQLYTFQKLKMTQNSHSMREKKEEPSQKQISSAKQNLLPYTPSKVFGLKNLGNTCFFNSVMQCLNGATPLMRFYLDLANLDFSQKNIIEIQQTETSEDDGWSTVETQTNKKKKQQSSKTSFDDSGSKLINTKYQQFLVQARRSKGNIHDPQDLFKSVSVIYGRFRSMAQQDAQELLRCFLDALSTGEEKVMKARGESKPTTDGKAKWTPVENIFGSYLCNYLECLDCGHISRTFDFCLDLAIQISKPRESININHLRNPASHLITVAYPKTRKDSKQDEQVEEAQQIEQTNYSTGDHIQPDIEQQSEVVDTGIVQDELKSDNLSKSQNKNKNKNKKKNKSKNNEQTNNVLEPEPEVLQEELDDGSVVQENKDQETHFKVVENLLKYEAYSYSEIPQNQLEKEKVPYFNHSSNILLQIVEKDIAQIKSNALTLENCLDSFTGFELLNLKNNYFKCESCGIKNKKSSRAIRKFYLYETPPILTIVLKRFSQKSTGRFEKVVEHVEFEEYLDVGQYVLAKGYVNQMPEEIIKKSLENQTYKLLGVVVHSGTMSGGHYVAYVRHQEQNEDHWYYYSDTTFKEVSLKNVLSSQAYILFYEKVVQS